MAPSPVRLCFQSCNSASLLREPIRVSRGWSAALKLRISIFDFRGHFSVFKLWSFALLTSRFDFGPSPRVPDDRARPAGASGACKSCFPISCFLYIFHFSFSLIPPFWFVLIKDADLGLNFSPMPGDPQKCWKLQTGQARRPTTCPSLSGVVISYLSSG